MWLFGKKKASERKLSPEQEQVQAFARRFEAQEMTLVAVTGMQGASHTRENEDELWTVRVPLTAWMDAFDAVVHHQPASLEILADDRLLGYLLQRLPRNFILKAKVRPALEGDAFQLVDMPEPGFDPELKAVLDEQVKPVVLDGGALGKFTLNRGVDQFQAEVKWLERPVLLVFDRGQEEQGALDAAGALLADIPGWDARLRAFAASRLLEQVNGLSAEDEDFVPLTEEELAQQLEPELVQAEGDDGVRVWLGSDLLYGRSIRVDAALSAGPTQAVLED
ncbi:MAG: DUF2262 domain-containing protein [Oscillospiraceae bacterium]|nr:DUF2262 domain-containing protein [Oscillospiraceae bacterium]